MTAVLNARSAKDIAPRFGNNAQFAVVFSIITIVIVAPLAVIDTPLLTDYPNHVARMHILGNVDRDLLLAERYAIQIDLIPNIAMDIVVPWLAKSLPLDLAARIFLGSCVVLTLASTACLHRTLFNQWSLYSLTAALFVYHGSMIAGLANFSLGIGLVPAALAIWIRMQEANATGRILVGCAMTLLLFFCHLVAFGAFGLLVIGNVIAHARDHWNRPDRVYRVGSEVAIAGATGLLPLILFLRIALDDAQQSTPAGIVYGNFGWKLKALLSPLANYSPALDVASFALVVGLALVIWWSGCLRVDRRMVPGLALLATAFVIAPKALWTGGVFDQRLAILLALMLVACTRFEGQQTAISRLAPALLALLFIVRMSVLTSAWLDHRGDLAEMRRAIDLMTPGGRILVVQPDDTAGYRLAPPRHRVFHHAVQMANLPTLAVAESSAFVSTIYALPGQQPLILKPPFDQLGGYGPVGLPTLDELSAAHEANGARPTAKQQIKTWSSDFDYLVLVYGYGAHNQARIGDMPIELLMDGDILDLFRIVKN